MIYLLDIIIYLIVLCVIYGVIRIRRSPNLRAQLARIFENGRYWVALMILCWFAMIGFLDSIHLKQGNLNSSKSLLDVIVSPRDSQFETTYSAPFATHLFTKQVIKKADGQIEEVYPKLEYVNIDLSITSLSLRGIGIGALIFLLIYFVFRRKINVNVPKPAQPTFWITLSFIIIITAWIYSLMFQYHIFGTDKTGQDVFYIALKSIRTGLVIGTVTTFVMLPFALFFGMWAGYFRGWVDDVIQYVYTTLSSVPAVLLIAAAVVSLQTKTEQYPELRLLVLCIILGVTSWIGLCRLLRGETLKLREMEFVQVARAMGVSHFSIIRRHILPNLLHIVVISLILDFSALVLAEAVLSFIGVGVDPSTQSFGNMINAARLEMARDPMVWWSLSASFIFMFLLVFSANILAEAIQDALNTRRQ